MPHELQRVGHGGAAAVCCCSLLLLLLWFVQGCLLVLLVLPCCLVGCRCPAAVAAPPKCGRLAPVPTPPHPTAPTPTPTPHTTPPHPTHTHTPPPHTGEAAQASWGAVADAINDRLAAHGFAARLSSMDLALTGSTQEQLAACTTKEELESLLRNVARCRTCSGSSMSAL